MDEERVGKANSERRQEVTVAPAKGDSKGSRKRAIGGPQTPDPPTSPSQHSSDRLSHKGSHHRIQSGNHKKVSSERRKNERQRGEHEREKIGNPDFASNSKLVDHAPSFPIKVTTPSTYFFPLGFLITPLHITKLRARLFYSHGGATTDGEQTDRIPQRRSACRTSLAQL
jgi:hypothetical protein